MTQTWVSNGQLTLWPALLGVHGVLTLMALARIWWRDGGLVTLVKGRTA
jgi:hypothetical protein